MSYKITSSLIEARVLCANFVSCFVYSASTRMHEDVAVFRKNIFNIPKPFFFYRYNVALMWVFPTL